MSQNEFKRYRLAIDVLEGRLLIKDFALLINRSYRQAQRIVKRIESLDVQGAYHGNCGKLPHNKTSTLLESKVIDLLQNKYRDFNLTHFREFAEKYENLIIKKDALYRIAKSQGLIKNPKRRGRRSHRPRPRMPSEGMMVQFDGSEHNWFGDEVCDLISGIDDATGKVLAAEFFYGEKSNHSMKVIREIVDKNGLPESFYMDQAGIYGKVNQESESQISRAFEQTGVRLILAGSSQAKGRIERLWRTFQDRLIAELKLHDIRNIADANQFLKNRFVPAYNAKFGVAPVNPNKSYRKNIFGNLDLIFCKKERRKIMSGNIFSWNNVTWVVEEKNSYSGREISINCHTDGQESFDIMGKKVKCRIHMKKRLSDYGNRSKLRKSG